MPCHCAHDQAAARLFSRFAHHYRRRFARGRFEPIQKRLLQALEEAGFQGAEILEVGCGVGALHLHLLQRGAARATGIDLSPQMIDEARDWARQQGVEHRVNYHVGDYLEWAERLSATDITVMDKVICCHPLGPELVAAALPRTRRLLALSYPRINWLTRAGAGMVNALMRLLGSDFRVYLHDPQRIEAVATAYGFEKRHQAHAGLWQVQLFQRRS